MSRSRLLPGALALATVASFAIAGHVPEGCYVALERDAATPDDDAIACTATTYLADNGGTKAGNVDELNGGGATAILVDDEPTESVTAGAGAGHLGTSYLQLVAGSQEQFSTGMAIAGEYSGVLDNLDVTLHGFHTGYGALPVSTADPTGEPNPTRPTERNAMQAYVDFTVDGIKVMDDVEIETLMAPAETANAAETFRFRIAGIAALLDSFPGFDVDAAHTFELRVTPRFINTDPAVVFVFGTTEVPSTVVVNTDPAVEVEGLPIHQL